MVFDDDFMRLFTPEGERNFLCEQNGASWPPPKFVYFDGEYYRLVSYSAITDEQRAAMTHVCRGALYECLGNTVHDIPALRLQ